MRLHSLLKSSLALLFLIGSLSGCKKEADEEPTPPPGGSGGGGYSVEVMVLNEAGFPLSGASVSSGSAQATSGANGTASLSGAPANDGKIVVKVELDGYFNGYRNVSVIGSSLHYCTVRLIEEQVIGTTDANTAGTINAADFRLELNGQGFQNGQGDTITGTINVSARYINASDPDIIADLMPGGDFSAVGEFGEEGVLESYGFTAFGFTDDNGTQVFPNSGSAQVVMQLPQDAIDQINNEGANAWFFDDISGQWVFGGAITVSGTEVYMPVTSSGYGNCDKLRARGTIKAEFLCGTDPLINVEVKLRTTGAGFARTYNTSTNANGRILVEVAVNTSGSTYNVTIQTYSQSVTVMPNEIEDMGQVDACSGPPAPQPCPGMPTVTDIDGNVYNTVQIGGQCWMMENLRTSTYRNNTPIPNVTDSAQWVNLASGAWCNFNNTANDAILGKLYNWYAVDNAAGLCPLGWHVPAEDDWLTLINHLGGSSVAGGKMKSTGIQYWLAPNTGATNESGFSALPGGLRDTDGYFGGGTSKGQWWSATEFWQQPGAAAESYYMFSSSAEIYWAAQTNTFGFCVRCVAD
ncbi:MAG: fibrobacter succinogenes major paralogous domain-containing protein [Flavobacteriales bacterium]|nr:fibrobacter succinogenes major paralogous domain-containing protein [Flavobacteriales bacterium]